MGKAFQSKVEYIGVMKKALQAREDFDDLKYYKHNYNGAEYLNLLTLSGDAFWYDITGFSNAMILQTIAEIVDGKRPACQIIDRKEILEVARQVR